MDILVDSIIILAAENAAVDMRVQIYFQGTVFIFFRIAGSYGSSIFKFFMSLHSAFYVTAPIYIPSNSAQGFPFFHIFANTFVSSLYQMPILTGVK